MDKYKECYHILMTDIIDDVTKKVKIQNKMLKQKPKLQKTMRKENQVQKH